MLLSTALVPPKVKLFAVDIHAISIDQYSDHAKVIIEPFEVHRSCN